MVFERKVIAREPAEGMDDHHIERRAAACGHVKKALQLWAFVVSTAQARIDKLNHDLPAARGAEVHSLAALVGYGKITFGLAAR